VPFAFGCTSGLAAASSGHGLAERWPCLYLHGFREFYVVSWAWVPCFLFLKPSAILSVSCCFKRKLDTLRCGIRCTNESDSRHFLMSWKSNAPLGPHTRRCGRDRLVKAPHAPKFKQPNQRRSGRATKMPFIKLILSTVAIKYCFCFFLNL
jgi:hypothetical protein